MIDYNARMSEAEIAKLEADRAAAWVALRAELKTYKGLPCNNIPRPYAKPPTCALCGLLMREWTGLRTPPVYLLIERCWACWSCYARQRPVQAAAWAAMWGED